MIVHNSYTGAVSPSFAPVTTKTVICVVMYERSVTLFVLVSLCICAMILLLLYLYMHHRVHVTVVLHCTRGCTIDAARYNYCTVYSVVLYSQYYNVTCGWIDGWISGRH